ncbi:cupin [Antrihabitans cavernicola]|uniref:Cupin n=1 Tax=Antrihabitans cavernicola TaxID=2495913 RepID=A0A5A7SHQ1_9NOCA|nr:cupin [Spelaeibacter cavernicola]KAA0024025.1 cupin [Spelaeibacter cavernicola]
MRSLPKVAVVLSALAVSIAVPGIAQATPSSGVTAVTFAQGTVPAGLIPFVAGATDVTIREITIAPGGTTGWHFHDGPVVGIVRAGTLTHPGPDCKPVVFDTGAIIDEPSGDGYVHIGRNLGTTPVILDVAYLQPTGKPLFEDAPAPACVGTGVDG